MALQSISAYGASPVFQTLVSESQVSGSVFSFKLRLLEPSYTSVDQILRCTLVILRILP